MRGISVGLIQIVLVVGCSSHEPMPSSLPPKPDPATTHPRLTQEDLLKSAHAKNVHGISGQAWLEGLTRPEWEAVIASEVANAVQKGDIGEIVYGGLGGQTEKIADFLADQVDGPHSKHVAKAVRELGPLARHDVYAWSKGSKINDFWAVHEGPEEAAKLGAPLEPHYQAFQREIDDYFARK